MEYAILFLPLIGSLLGYLGRSTTKYFAEISTSLFVSISAVLSILVFWNGIQNDSYGNYKSNYDFCYEDDNKEDLNYNTKQLDFNGYESLDDRAIRRKKLAENKTWQAYIKKGMELIEHQESKILIPANFSEIK